MRELRIEEQKSICGGTHYQFDDKTSRISYVDDNYDKLQSIRYSLKAQGHKVTRIVSYE